MWYPVQCENEWMRQRPSGAKWTKELNKTFIHSISYKSGVRASDKKPEVDIGDKARSIKSKFENGEVFKDEPNHPHTTVDDSAVFEHGEQLTKHFSIFNWKYFHEDIFHPDTNRWKTYLLTLTAHIEINIFSIFVTLFLCLTQNRSRQAVTFHFYGNWCKSFSITTNARLTNPKYTKT